MQQVSLKLELGREGEGPMQPPGGLPEGKKADFPAHLGLLASSSPPQPPEHGRDYDRQDNAPQSVHILLPGACGYVRIRGKGE